MSRRYLWLRLALALGSAFLAAIVSQQLNRSLSAEVIAKSEIADALDDVQLSVANMMLAFMQIRLAGDAQQAGIVRGDLRRGARMILADIGRLRAVVGEGNLGAATLSILDDPMLDPLRTIEDVAMVAMAAGDDTSPFGPRAERISSAGLDLSRRVLPVLKRMKETEREAHEAASRQLVRGGWWALGLSALVLSTTALFLFLPLERRILAAQDEIDRRREAAERASAAKTDFLATMSHEIRTPMNGVLGMAEVLRGTGLDPPQRRMLDIIVQSGQSLMDIINGVLDLAKIEAGRLDLLRAPFSVAEVAEDVVALFSGAAMAKGISLTAEVDPGVAVIYEGDPGAVRQMLSNLVGNAVKFTETGSITVSVMPEHGAARRDGVRIAVRDTGVGIPLDAQARIFESFQQADATTTRRFGGSGLGLAIVSRLVAAMGGRVSVESAPGEGATFTVMLPLRAAGPRSQAPVRAAPAPVTSAPVAPAPVAPAIVAPAPAPMPPRATAPAPVSAPASAAPGALAGLCILVAEDNTINQIVVRAMLEQMGCTVEIAEDGMVAVEAFRAKRPDLILMDVSMPNLDGYGATAAIRALEAAEGWAPVPIIGLSAHALAEAEQTGRASGMDMFLTKPITAEALATALCRQTTMHPRAETARVRLTEAS